MIERPACLAKKLRISPSVRSVRSASERLITYSKRRRRATTEARVSSRARTIDQPAHMTWRGRRMKYTSGRFATCPRSVAWSCADIFASTCRRKRLLSLLPEVARALGCWRAFTLRLRVSCA
jgi:hypothetical protein